MINHFTFNGTSTAQLGLIVSGVSIFGAGSRKVEKAGIPGRNGDLQIELGGFNNYTVRYTVSITKNFTTTAQQIREWLLESKGYCNLTDTYHPDEIRKACFNSDIEFTTSMLYKYGQASIQFDCLPERYLTTNTPITTTATADTTTDTTMSLSTVPTPINISLNGNTTQEGSSGKNLFGFIASDFTGAYGSANYVEITGLTEGTYYTCSSNAPTGYIWFGKNANSSQGTINFNRVYEGNPVTVQVDSMEKITVGILASDKTTALSYNTQIEQGSTATAYEPHISPTNPQGIHNVSGDNTVNVTSKNIAKFEEPYLTANANYTHTDNSINISASGTYARVGYSFKVQTGKQYSISFKAVKSNGSYGLIHVDNNNSWNNSYGGFTLTTSMAEYTKTITANTDILFIGFYVTSNMTTGTMTVNDFMIEVGSTATTYEPYTRQCYPLYLPVENLNKIADVKSGWLPATGAYPTTNGSYPNAQYLIVPLNKGETCYLSGTINIKGRVRAMNTSTVIGTVTANTTYYTTTADQSSGFKEGSITALQDLLLGILFMDGYTSSGGNELIIAKGTNIQNYAIELNKIGTYQDYIYKNGGKWYVHKEIGRYAFIGANEEGWTLTSSYTNNTRYSEAIITARTSGSALSNYFTKGTAGTDTTNIDINGSNGKIMITIPNTIASTVNDLKTWLSTHNTEVYYVLATPTNTEITDTTLINQLNNIEKAYSYNGTTNILQVSNDNGFMLEVVSLHGSTFNSNYKGEPIITVNSTGLIYLNGEVMEVLSAPVAINCQTMQCYNGVINMNNEVRVNDFPEIKIGANEVGSSMALTITPNNWRH